MSSWDAAEFFAVLNQQIKQRLAEKISFSDLKNTNLSNMLENHIQENTIQNKDDYEVISLDELIQSIII